MSVSVRTDRTLARAEARSTRYLLVTVTAPDASARTKRLPAHVSLVLDRSGSMSHSDKFDLARKAVERALAMLRVDDRFSLAVFDHAVDLIAPLQEATEANRTRALDVLRRVEPRGNTALHDGWATGCDELKKSTDADVVRRALLLTDGQANQGVTDPDRLEALAAERRRDGVSTSTFGVGADFDERLLHRMSTAGMGNFYFIEAAGEIPRYVAAELGEALEVTLREAAVKLALPRGATAELVSTYPVTAQDDVLRVELGDLVARQEVQLVFAVKLPTGAAGGTCGVDVSLVGKDHAPERASVSWTFASHAENDRQPRDRAVDQEVARLYLARARAVAAEANRGGDLRRAEEVLRRTLRKIESYAGDDPVLRALLGEASHEVHDFVHAAMSPSLLKEKLASSWHSSRSRAPSGSARRKP